MVIIKTEQKYRKELKEAYDRGYKDGLDKHELSPKTAFETIKTLARAGAKKKHPDMEQLNKMIDLVDHNYYLKEKVEEDSEEESKDEEKE